jgi:AcrR family transcriptional regulator
MVKTDSSIYKLREKKKKFLLREKEIKNSAISLLKKKGVNNVTVSLIARDVGVGKGTIYKHYASKAEILMSIVRDYEKNIADNILSSARQTNECDPLNVIRSYTRIRLSDPGLDRLVRHLEIQLMDDLQVAESMSQLLISKRSSIALINATLSGLTDRGLLQNAPPSYYYLSYIVLIEGAVDIYLGADCNSSIKDKEGLLSFISNIGVTIGKIGHD